MSAAAATSASVSPSSRLRSRSRCPSTLTRSKLSSVGGVLVIRSPGSGSRAPRPARRRRPRPRARAARSSAPSRRARAHTSPRRSTSRNLPESTRANSSPRCRNGSAPALGRCRAWTAVKTESFTCCASTAYSSPDCGSRRNACRSAARTTRVVALPSSGKNVATSTPRLAAIDLERGQRGNGLPVLDLGEVARREPAVCREQLERESLSPSDPLKSLPQMPEVVVDHGSSECKRIFPLG